MTIGKVALYVFLLVHLGLGPYLFCRLHGFLFVLLACCVIHVVSCIHFVAHIISAWYSYCCTRVVHSFILAVISISMSDVLECLLVQVAHVSLVVLITCLLAASKLVVSAAKV